MKSKLTIIIPLILAVVFSFFFIRSYDSFLSEYDNSVDVSAEIYTIKETTDSDGDTEYEYYVHYTHNGKSYNEKYITSSSGNKYNIGQTVTIKVDSRNPKTMLKDSASATTIFFVLSLTSISYLFCCFVDILKQKKCSLKPEYSKIMLNETIIRRQLSEENKFDAIGYAGYVLSGLIMIGFAETDIAIVDWASLAGLALFLYNSWKLVKHTIVAIKCKKSTLYVYEVPVDSKKVNSDSDSDTTYHIVYTDSKMQKNSLELSKDLFDEISVGDRIYIAFCNKEKRIYPLSKYSYYPDGSHGII